ncbi:MAG: cob(I)yrinic acid a,c-diamide adenosyltransferase [Verrucomicrobiota bacterium]
MNGYVQVYTGNGKGKTTAALGLIMRASGAGLKSYFCQFIKGQPSSELKVLTESLPGVTCVQYGLGRFFTPGHNPSLEDINAARKGIRALETAMLSGSYNLAVADEIIVAVKIGLVKMEQVCRLIDLKPDNLELVLTGRDAPPEIIARADLVTEMRNIKHYFSQNVRARKGVEY